MHAYKYFQSYTSCESPLLYIVNNRLRSYMAYVVRRPAIHSIEISFRDCLRRVGVVSVFLFFKFVGLCIVALVSSMPLLDPCDESVLTSSTYSTTLFTTSP